MERDANARYSTAQEFIQDLVDAKRQMQEKRRAMMQTGPRMVDQRADGRRQESVVPAAPRSAPRTVESDEWDNQPTVPVRAMSRPARTA
jgi:hypothetical protein